MTVHTFRTWIPWVAAALAIPIAAAQGRGTSGTGGTGTPNTGTTRSTTTSPTTTGNTSTTTTPSPTTPIFLSGRVQMEDGTPPPEGVRIERVCGGATHTEGFTDTNGNFGIQIGSVENAAYQDASDTGSDGLRSMGGTGAGNSGGFNSGLGTGVADRRLTNCDLRARLGGYRSQSISLTGRRPMDNPDVGVILLHKDSGEGARRRHARRVTPQEPGKGRQVEREGCSDRPLAWFHHAAGVGTSRRFVMGITAQARHRSAF